MPNGLDVVLHEDHTTPTITVNCWYHVVPAAKSPAGQGSPICSNI